MLLNLVVYNVVFEEVVVLLCDLGYLVEVWGWDEVYFVVVFGIFDDFIEVVEEI